MDIVKSMNLNKIPQHVQNGSLVFAKNIKITDNGTAITADDGFIKVIPDNSIEGNIVGFISCVEEIIIFSYNEENNKSNIYRLREINNTNDLEVIKVYSAWTYSGGIIKGTYTYNINKELIISIAESPKEGENKNIPLKTINLNTCSSIDLEAAYEVAPRIPIANLKLVSKVLGNNMPNGLYYFFIRYEIIDGIFTKWFPIGIPHYALSLKQKTLIDHYYQNGNNATGDVLYTHVSGVYNNVNADCPYNFKFKLKVNKTYNYNNCQIGYILQHDTKTVARIWRTFNLSTETEFIFDAKNYKETNIDELLDNVFNIFNVENITNYENRLYIANFKETNYNENLQHYADKVKARICYKVGEEENVVNEKYNTKIYTFRNTSNNDSFELELPENTNRIRILDYNKLYEFFRRAYGTKFDTTTLLSPYEINPKILVKDAYLLLTNNSIHFYDVNGNEHTDFHADKIWFNVTSRPRRFYGDTFNVPANLIQITSKDNIKYTTSIYIDNTIRTLLPNNVYNFFIHYVREDGTFTNGLQIKNDKDNLINTRLFEADKNSGGGAEHLDMQLGDIKRLLFKGEEQYLNSIAEVKEFQDKYLYEIASNTNLSTEGIHKFGYYKNYNNDNLFVTGNGYWTNTNKFIKNTVLFNNIEIPEGFVGFFISYEKPENHIICNVKCIDEERRLYKASDVEVGINNYIGTIYHSTHVSDDSGILSNVYNDSPYFVYVKSASISISNIQTKQNEVTVNSIGKEGVIYLDLRNYDGGYYKPQKGEIAQIRMFNRNIYCNKEKILIPFGPVVAGIPGKLYSYGEYKKETNIIGDILGDVDDNLIIEIEDETNDDSSVTETIHYNPVINEDYNLPAFITTDKYLTYTRPIYIDDNTGKVYDIDSSNNIPKTPTTNREEYAKLVSYNKFCNYNLLALSIKKEPEILVGVIGDANSAEHNKNVSTVVKPINATDLIEYKSDFKEQVHKSYTCFDIRRRDNSIKKSIIRRSNVIQDESVENSWRNFGANAYKVINKNKGNITNLIGVGNMFYIHTEHSMLSMDKNSMLKTQNQEIQLATPDLFDVEPQELFTGQHGFGGLQLKDAWCLNQNGYWFYDSANKRFYNFDNNKINDISLDIIDWINNRTIKDVRFITDFKTDRVLICIKYSSNNIEEDYATFSINMTTKQYISTHDYYFTESINTKNNVYFYDSILKNNLYIYHISNIGDYKLLANNSIGFPDNHELVIVKTDNGEEKRVIQSSVIDIIFNESYGLPRVLDSISYILNKRLEYENMNVNRMAEPFTNDGTLLEQNRYSGDILRIYTDQTDSGNLDISQPTIINVLNSYKVPHFERGIWQLNYFRNYINVKNIDKELMFKLGITDLNSLSDEQRKRYNQIKANYSFSDNRSLIYGKYIVLRFIFRNLEDRKPFILNDVSVNIKPY